MKIILLAALSALLLPLLAHGEGPRFSHKDAIVDREFENVYQDIRSLRSVTHSDTDVILNQDTLQTGATFYVSSGTVSGPLYGSSATFSGQLIGKGTVTNDSACVGCIGEIVESIITVETSLPTSGQWGDLTSISLTRGDWSLYGTVTFVHNGATYTGEMSGGIHTTSGNSTPAVGSRGATFAPTATVFPAAPVPGGVRISVAATTTVYLKMIGTYSAGTPKAVGAIRGRRER